MDYFLTWFWSWADFREIRRLSIIHCMLLPITHNSFTVLRQHFYMLGWLCNWLDDCSSSCNLCSGRGLEVRFPGNLLMFKIKSESNPLELRSICWQSCHIIHQIKARNLYHNNRAMATKITQMKNAPESWHCPPFGQKSGSVKTWIPQDQNGIESIKVYTHKKAEALSFPSP